MVNAISIAHHHDLTSMIYEYVQDEDYASILESLSNDIPHEPYYFKDGFLLHGSILFIRKNQPKIFMYESQVPPYAQHHSI